MIDVTEQGDIAIVHMRYGKANALDIAFCEALALRFERLRTSSSRGVVITGQGKMFCAGVDLPQMAEGGIDYVLRFLKALDRLYTEVFNFPKPVVAAVNGHAIAGGCILACAADHRLMAKDSGRMGVTEILVGVPFPQLAFEIMRTVTSVRLLPEAILTGATYTSDGAVERGWINELVEPTELLDKAVAAANKLAAVAPAAFAFSKRQIRQPANERLQKDGPALDAEIEKIWTAPETAARVHAFVEKTLKKA
jgi:enoyl-CoA hydratase